MKKEMANFKHRKQKLLKQRIDNEKKEKESDQKFLDKVQISFQ